ncbi:MAG TPA: hypothetical protein DCS24_05345 [Erythrobacter sp.]|nr:hypothetical protein [Erythrobacter sp.]
MKAKKLTAMLAVMGGLSVATAACTQEAGGEGEMAAEEATAEEATEGCCAAAEEGCCAAAE